MPQSKKNTTQKPEHTACRVRVSTSKTTGKPTEKANSEQLRPGASYPTPQMALELLHARYPDVACALEYHADPWRLLVMARLSAQCTDARVNEVSKTLFAVFPNAAAMAAGDLTQIEQIVRPCGLFRTKARNIRDASAILIEKYGGVVPDDMDALLTLPGVGRKIANLILGDVYGQPAIVADTHCIRLSGRMGFCNSKDPVKVEFALKDLIPPAEQSDFCHRLVWFGREVCRAQNPACDDCPFPCKRVKKVLKNTQKTTTKETNQTKDDCAS